MVVKTLKLILSELLSTPGDSVLVDVCVVASGVVRVVASVVFCVVASGVARLLASGVVRVVASVVVLLTVVSVAV